MRLKKLGAISETVKQGRNLCDNQKCDCDGHFFSGKEKNTRRCVQQVYKIILIATQHSSIPRNDVLSDFGMGKKVYGHTER